MRVIPGKGGLMMHLNPSKAFDRVDHQYLEAVLAAVGFDPVFCGRITTLYSDIESTIQVNDFFPEPFCVEKFSSKGD